MNLLSALARILLSLAVLAAPWANTAATQDHPPAGSDHQESVSAAPQGKILPPRQGYRFPLGQTYVFGVEWHLINAGTATLGMEAAGEHHRVSVHADSSGVVNLLYKVRDQFAALIDPQTFCSAHLFKHTEEGSRKRETNITYDYARHKSVLDEKNLKKNESKHLENDIPECVSDVVSGFYYVASLPLEPGSTMTFPINDGKTTLVQAVVEKREQVKVPAGTFQTVLVSAEAISGPLKGKGNVEMWFSDDANHVPVQMKSKLGWGSLLFRLQRIDKATAAPQSQ
ncbi:MAG TPA: DUF3108 domain-containing protein [Terriglobales bacterium]|jgi:hypothetical protein